MQDRLHQQYRTNLVPGLAETVRLITPSSHQGVLGVCLSGKYNLTSGLRRLRYVDEYVGAGPTILALATHNFEAIAQAIIKIFVEANPGTHCQWKLLDPAFEGATVSRFSR